MNFHHKNTIAQWNNASIQTRFLTETWFVVAIKHLMHFFFIVLSITFLVILYEYFKGLCVLSELCGEILIS